ncbi:glycosyltransferase family 4 protein [Wenyingzhuangia sp. 2_MG-2023]|uniref:glycosyltransferase family 4 protein n=1 Tax=Wenyingzhuangia sp. 2_MG-2023 TaxID=3062639 RepID=UPI0026E2FEA6|nr:glycosyltransferase family 4 protein [Wenyingzhuangia sp. 2_MG-2023]MDO6739091.1 glycosyltransferase family 4 protein [Wenyingzhuangia sp. 2_MG-2023]
MKIGIVSLMNINALSELFPDENSKEVLKLNARNLVATAVHTLIKSLVSEGHFVRVFTLSKNNFYLKGKGIELYGIEFYDGYPIKYLWGDFIDSKRIRRQLKNNISDLDVIHAHWTYTFAFASKFYTTQIPVFCTVRDWATYIWKIESTKNKITWSFRCILNELVLNNKKVNFIANSPYTAARIEKKYGIKVPIIPNPINQSFLRYDKTTIPENLEIICISSSNDKRKNVRTLLLAFQQLLIKYPHAHLSLIGEPFTKESESMQLWEKEGMLKKVSLVGLVNHSELQKYLDKARVFVSPSLEETFGNTLLESMARKIPIVAGISSGAIPYVLQHGELGYLCDVSNPNNIYKTIEYVYLNPEKVEKITEVAFDVLNSKYLDKKITEKHIELYKSVLDNRK